MSPLDNIVIDGTENGEFEGDATNPPFALFSPELQATIGGPYAKREHAEEALAMMREGVLNPFFTSYKASLQWRALCGEDVEID